MVIACGVMTSAANAALVTGSYVGNGSGGQDIVGLGFEPTVVIVKAEGNDSAVIRTASMPGLRSRHLVGEWGLMLNRIHVFQPDGFRVGNDDDVNQAGVTYHYIAFDADPGYLATGTVTGDGNPTRSVDGLGFAPAMVIVIPHGAPRCRFRTTAMPAGYSVPFGDDSEDDDTLIALDADGFTIGAGDNLNDAGAILSYLAFAAGASSMNVGSYTGDGNNGRTIGSLDLTPAWLLTKQFGSKRGAHLTAGLSGTDQTLTFAPDPVFTGGIRSLEPGQFVIDSSDRVNEDGHTYYYAAFADRGAATGSDLAMDLAVDDLGPDRDDLITLTATIDNLGPATADGATLTVDLPAGLSLQSLTIDPGAVGDQSVADRLDVSWDLPAGEQRQIVAVYRVDDGPASRLIEGQASGGEADPAPANDEASLTLAIPTVDLQVGLSSSDPSPAAGAPVVLTVEAVNPSADVDAVVAIDLAIPAGMTVAAATPSHGTHDIPTGHWTVGTLPAGATATLDLDLVVGADQHGATLTPTASGTSDRNDDDLTSNTASLTHAVGGGSDLSATAAFDPATAAPGDPVDLTLQVTNHGPDAAATVTGTVSLPNGLTYQSAAPGSGSYVPATGVWDAGSLPAGATTTLVVTTLVTEDEPASLTATFAVAADGADPEPGNNLATAQLVTAGGYDLALDVDWSPAAGNAGEPATLELVLENLGPGQAPGATMAVDLPADFLIATHDADLGAFDPALGTWTIDHTVDAGASHSLVLTCTTPVDAAGIASATAAIATGDGDLDPTNDTGSADLALTELTDLAVAASFDLAAAGQGDTVNLLIAVTNAGPSAASGFVADVTLPAILTPVAHAATTGAWDQATGAWTSDDTLAPGAEHDLVITVTVAAGEEGMVTAPASITAAGTDPQPSDNASSASLEVLPPPDLTIEVVPFASLRRTLMPGGPADDVLHVRLVNLGGQPASLDAITFHNPAPDDGNQSAHDAHWSQLLLQSADQTLGSGTFTAGAITFTGLSRSIPAGDHLDLTLRGTAALDAPDGTVLQPLVQDATDLAFALPLDVVGTWPLMADGTLTVDGMSAAQITLHQVGAEIFQMGSVRNLALDVTVPSNGQQPDVMTKLNVVNLGTATAGDVITRVEAWADDGDGILDTSADTWIAELFWTGGKRFEATSLDVAVPAAGRRIYVTVDVADDALGGTVQLSLPADDDPAIGMLSGNDGPLDRAVVNPLVQTISATDKVIVTAATIASSTVAPGATEVPLLALVARNLYDEACVLERLRVRNLTTGTGDPGQSILDRVTNQVRLHRDGNGNGRFDGAALDPVIASTTWDGGLAVFDALAWHLAPDVAASVFVTTTVSLTAAAEADTIGAAVGSAADLTFDRDLAVVAAWPLDSGGRHTVDGLVAAQVQCPAVPPVSLAASEGPVLALDLTVPGNGYLGDTLDRLRLQNLGSARAGDIADLGLWTDADRDGAFDPDRDLRVATFTAVDANWVALDVDQAVAGGGQRFFVGLTVTDTPADSSTVRLQIPMDGLAMTSDHDGPLDAAVTSPTALLISTAPLLSTMSFATARSTTEMTVTVTMSVVNVGSEAVNAIVPGALTITGDGALTLASGPTPASLDLPDGGRGTFTWTYTAEAAGNVQVTGRCEGVSAVGGQPRGSLATASAPHRVLAPALDLQLYPVANMPFSINRGQTGVVPLTLTLLNDGGAARAELAVRRLVITLDDGDGNPVVPADLLSRVTVGEGINVYCDITAPESVGQTLTLDLDPEVVVTASEPVTLGLRLDVSSQTDIERFRIGLLSADDLAVVDRVSGAERSVVLTDHAFPVRSAAGSIVSQATGLTVMALPRPDLTAGAGQDAVSLLSLSLTAEGGDHSSEVKVGAFVVSLVDPLGQQLSDGVGRLSRIWVDGPLAVHAVHNLVATDSLIAFDLSPQISVPVGAAGITVTIVGQVRPDPVLGPLSLQLGEPASFDARDGNVSSSVAVAYQPADITGPRVTIQQPAPTLLANVVGRLPEVLPQGARGALALTITLNHPGSEGSAAAHVDTLRLTCLDADRQPQEAARVLDGAVVTWNGAEVGNTVLSTASQVLIPLDGQLLAAGQAAEIRLVVDIEADAPAGGFELLVDADLLTAHDANLMTPVAVAAGDGARLPATSGLARIQPASSEVQVDWQDRLPALLASGGQDVPVVLLSLANPSASGSAPALLQSLTLRFADRDHHDLAGGAIMTGATALVDGQPWATIDGVGQDDQTLTLTGDTPLTIAAGATVELDLRVVPRAGATATGVRIGLDQDDLRCTQNDGTTPITVRPAAGLRLPLWTGAAGMAGGDLAASYINFPNPFAAGRQATRFAFQLPHDAHVTLRIRTPRGDAVATLLDDQPLAFGLHQDLDWDGRNDRGTAVRNGVYLAELMVRYPDGGSDLLRRKVAVVR